MPPAAGRSSASRGTRSLCARSASGSPGVSRTRIVVRRPRKRAILDRAVPVAIRHLIRASPCAACRRSGSASHRRTTRSSRRRARPRCSPPRRRASPASPTAHSSPASPASPHASAKPDISIPACPVTSGAAGSLRSISGARRGVSSLITRPSTPASAARMLLPPPITVTGIPSAAAHCRARCSGSSPSAAPILRNQSAGPPTCSVVWRRSGSFAVIFARSVSVTTAAHRATASPASSCSSAGPTVVISPAPRVSTTSPGFDMPHQRVATVASRSPP